MEESFSFTLDKFDRFILGKNVKSVKLEINGKMVITALKMVLDNAPMRPIYY